LLDVGLLRLIGKNGVELLLVGVAKTGDIDLSLRIHGCGVSMMER
jgi:hypothetical protein